MLPDTVAPTARLGIGVGGYQGQGICRSAIVVQRFHGDRVVTDHDDLCRSIDLVARDDIGRAAGIRNGIDRGDVAGVDRCVRGADEAVTWAAGKYGISECDRGALTG